jgi:DNA ligase-1
VTIGVTGWDRELVRLCLREVGDTGEGIGHLLFGRTLNQPLTLAEAEVIFQRLAAARRVSLKHSILAETFSRYRPDAIRCFVKSLSGNFRMGIQSRMIREALELSGLSLGDLAPGVFRPFDFMLAKSWEEARESLTGGPDEAAQWLAEDKYDGIRAQVHWIGGEVRIYTRSLDDTTAAFPEVAERFAGRGGAAVLDGEVLAWREDRPLPFSVLQQRLSRKTVTAQLRADVPVEFIAYDLLHQDGQDLLTLTIEDRRLRLVNLKVRVSPQQVLPDFSLIEDWWAAARRRGNEGLVLKRRGSFYEPGKRSGAWLKVKKPFGTLDVVVTAAEQGHGRRATVFSDYTFAVRDGDRLVNIGKAYSGLTDEEIRELTRRFRGAMLNRFGRVMLVRPEVVLEVAFDGIQPSPRHKSGFALRFPRILRWRKDKGPEEIGQLEEVKAMYEASLRA